MFKCATAALTSCNRCIDQQYSALCARLGAEVAIYTTDMQRMQVQVRGPSQNARSLGQIFSSNLPVAGYAV
jgi:hypothetical protein